MTYGYLIALWHIVTPYFFNLYSLHLLLIITFQKIDFRVLIVPFVSNFSVPAREPIQFSRGVNSPSGDQWLLPFLLREATDSFFPRGNSLLFVCRGRMQPALIVGRGMQALWLADKNLGLYSFKRVYFPLVLLSSQIWQSKVNGGSIM